MNKVFEKFSINGLELKNRLIRSATWEGMCDSDGKPTVKLIDCYKKLAEGGVGLIITGYTYVNQAGKQMPGKMGLYNDEFSAEMKKIIDAVHGSGGKIGVQLVHAGGQAISKVSKMNTIAPSSVKVDQYQEVPKALSLDDINRIINDFGQAAKRLKDYGFDAVQLHGAHGYLINQFLSPLTNRRTDVYGGGIENRSRFMLEVYEAVRRQVGKDFPVLIKLNATDYLTGGLETDDARYAAKMLSDNGIDAIEVSAGTRASGELNPTRTNIDDPSKEGYNLSLALKIKEVVECPVISVGGFRSFETIENAINNNIDGVALSRPLIREPNLVNRWKDGNRSPSGCTSCNACFRTGLTRDGLHCYTLRRER